MEYLISIVLSVLGLYIGGIIATRSIDSISQQIHKSSFLVSFLVLGLLTSLTEISVAANSLAINRIEIAIGNLLGGSMILILFAVPILSLLTNKVKLNNAFGLKNSIFSILYILLPHLLLIDKHLSVFDSLILFMGFIAIIWPIYQTDRKSSRTPKANDNKTIDSKSFSSSLLFIALGSVLLILSSKTLVEKVYEIAQNIGVSPFILSLFALSLGTNLPEIGLAIVSKIKGRSDVAFGNYLGSAVFNIIILAVLGLINGGIHLNVNFNIILIFSLVGFLLFILFIRSDHSLSRKESIVLLGIYILFLVSEIMYSINV